MIYVEYMLKKIFLKSRVNTTLGENGVLHYVLDLISHMLSNPGLEHWTTAKCILKYLRKTKDLLLVYENCELRVDGFTDSDFQSDTDDRKSTSGFVFVYNDRVVS